MYEPVNGAVDTKLNSISFVYRSTDIQESFQKWTDLQKEWYMYPKIIPLNPQTNRPYRVEGLQNSNIGPGEISVALMLFQLENAYATDDYIKNNIGSVLTDRDSFINHMVQKGGTDIQTFKTHRLYEVKQTDVKKSVRTGVYGDAKHLLNLIHNDFKQIADAYSELSNEDKAIIQKHAPDNKILFSDIIQKGVLYFTENPKELPSSAHGVLAPDITKFTHIPRIFLIPHFLTKELHNEAKQPSQSDVENSSVEYLEHLYQINRTQAIYLDKYVKNHLKKMGVEVQGGTTLYDFLLIAEKTIFANPQKFKDNVQVFFEKGDRQQKLLEDIFPHTGLFVVDQHRGFMYAGKDKLNNLVKVVCISSGNFKISPHGEESSMYYV